MTPDTLLDLHDRYADAARKQAIGIAVLSFAASFVLCGAAAVVVIRKWR